jgi:predicted enzyme related to lactoylglutathione lyase
VLLYFGVHDVTATLAKIEANGGKVAVPPFEVPGVVILGLFSDPAGNRLGLVEMGADGKAKIP